MLFAISEPLLVAIGVMAAIAVLVPLGWTVAGILRYKCTLGQGFLLGFNLLLNRLRWHTRANRPMPLLAPGQGAVIVANHRSGFDPMFLQVAAARIVHWMVARQYCTWRLAWFFRILQCIPTGRGGIDTAAVKQAIRLAENGELVGIMPEGRINETEALMLPGRPGAALVALKARVPVIPCYVSGAPYNGHLLGPLFMRAHVEVTVGDPIDLSEYYGRDREPGVTAELTKRFMKEIARLGGAENFQPQLAGRQWLPDETEEAEEENHATP
jgi:1-acyl-sn-glycerol-3-phosphate acyltransferase